MNGFGNIWKYVKTILKTYKLEISFQFLKMLLKIVFSSALIFIPLSGFGCSIRFHIFISC